MALKLTSSHSFGLPPSTTNLRCTHVSKVITSRNSTVVEPKKPFNPQQRVHDQVTHSMPPEKIEIFRSLESWVDNNLLLYLKPVERSWQPQDFLPNSASKEFDQQILELKESAKGMPDEVFVVLVGEMIAEEALPTYLNVLNTLDGVKDETGASPTPWAVWFRGWAAEKNRHGDLLNKYVYLSRRVDMKQVEKTIQYLIGSGTDIGSENNPYLTFIYTSFQERATFVSYGNTGRLAKEHNNPKLAQICGTIAADEKRHAIAYSKIVEKLFEVDPEGTILAFEHLMRKNILMPANFLYDGQDENLYHHLSAVTQRIGVYTLRDYADVLEFLVGRWNVEKLRDLSVEAQHAQEYLCRLPARIRKAERTHLKLLRAPKIPFSWLFGREVNL